MPEIPRSAEVFQIWGLLTRAARDPELRARPGGVVQNVWENYKQSYLTAGEQPPPLGVRAVNALYSIAAGQVRAERQLGAAVETFRRTGFDQALTGDMFARDLDSRTGSGLQAPSLHRVRFGVQINVFGETAQRFVTWEPGLEMPQTVGGLLGSLEDVGASTLEKYGEEFDSLTDDVSLTAL